MTKYPTFDDQQDKLEEPTMSYNVSNTLHVAVKPLPVQERIILTEEMKTSMLKAEQDLADGNCLTEEDFQARFAKWL